MCKKAMILSLLLSVAFNSAVQAQQPDTPTGNLEVLRRVYEANMGNQQAAHEYAVALARGQQYAPALEIFRSLAENPEVVPEILFDYAVVSVWAEDYQTAVQLYETRISRLSVSVPDYVKTSIGGAYYRLKMFDQARQLYHAAGLSGDGNARRWEADSLAQAGDSEAAEAIYAELIRSNPKDSDTYISRAYLRFLQNDSVSAAGDVEAALAILEQRHDSDGIRKRQQVRADMAAQFIRSGDYPYGISLLKPVIADGSATITMQCDYILALFFNGDYKTAIAESSRLWKDNRQVPLYGRRALADSYLRNGQPDKALGIYHSLIDDSKGEVGTADKQSLAYAYLLSGDVKSGLTWYQNILSTEGNSRTGALADDADALMRQGRYYAAQRLYQLMIDQYPGDSIIRRRFAAALYAGGLLREAHEQYAALAMLPDSRQVGSAGIANTAVQIGDYHSARLAADYLQGAYLKNPIAAQAVGRFERRPLGDVEFSYQITNDYKGDNVKFAQVTAEQRIGDRLMLLSGTANKKVADDGGSASLNTLSAGVRYVDTKRVIQLWLDENRAGRNVSGYRFTASHYFGENSSLDFSVNRTPVEDAEALSVPIMATEYRLGVNRRIGLKNSYALGLGRSFYSDGNRTDGGDFTWTHTMLSTEAKDTDWFLYYNRLAFREQTINGEDTVYESPTVREAYGLGLRNRWNYAKHYWEGTLGLEWGRDRPDPIDFSPYARLEYGQSYSPAHTLVIGAEYGLRTGHSTNTGSNLQFGSRQYDISYRVNW